jgi:hypothetical protein
LRKGYFLKKGYFGLAFQNLLPYTPSYTLLT